LPFFDPSPPCVDSFFTLCEDQNRHFLTPFPPLVHVVIKMEYFFRPRWPKKWGVRITGTKRKLNKVVSLTFAAFSSSFSWSREQFFLTVVKNNFVKKIPLLSEYNNSNSYYLSGWLKTSYCGRWATNRKCPQGTGGIAEETSGNQDNITSIAKKFHGVWRKNIGCWCICIHAKKSRP
jgi:hypothetical protein